MRVAAIDEFAAAKFQDPGLSKEQKFARALNTPTGSAFYKASKLSPGREVEMPAATSEIADIRLGKKYPGEGVGTMGTGAFRGNRSTQMSAISNSDDAAYLTEALAIDSGRAGRIREAMRLDVVPKGGNSGADQEGGSAGQEARARAARRHAQDDSKSFERHHANVLRDDPGLAQRVLREERNRAQKRIAAVA